MKGQIQSQMRVPEVERGDSLFTRILIRFISMVSGMRLPDAARIVMYHKKFYGDAMGAWTHTAMRGKSGWTVGERELMAAMTAKWNECPFCIDAHRAIASLELGKTIVSAALADTENPVSKKVQAALVLLKKLTLYPDEISTADVQTALDNGITHEELQDAIAVSSLFNITARCANAFNFAILTEKDLEKAAKRMLVQGYVFGKKGIPERPDHNSLAKMLRQRIFEGQGITDSSLRQAIGKRSIGDASIDEPYNEMAIRIGKAAYKVTNEQITNVIKKAGSDKAALS